MKAKKRFFFNMKLRNIIFGMFIPQKKDHKVLKKMLHFIKLFSPGENRRSCCGSRARNSCGTRIGSAWRHRTSRRPEAPGLNLKKVLWDRSPALEDRGHTNHCTIPRQRHTCHRNPRGWASSVQRGESHRLRWQNTSHIRPAASCRLRTNKQ
jgi:hypothetical protein